GRGAAKGHRGAKGDRAGLWPAEGCDGGEGYAGTGGIDCRGYCRCQRISVWTVSVAGGDGKGVGQWGVVPRVWSGLVRPFRDGRLSLNQGYGDHDRRGIGGLYRDSVVVRHACVVDDL